MMSPATGPQVPSVSNSLERSQSDTAAATAVPLLSEWVPGMLDDSAVRARRWHPERVALALYDERRDTDGLELGEAALLGVSRWMDWKREADEGDRVGLDRRAAGDAGARRAAAGQEREPAERAVPQLEHDRGPRSVQLACRSRAPSTRNPVRLLDERDAEPGRTGGFGSGDQIGRLDPAAGPVTKHKPGNGRGNRKKVRSSSAVRSVELDHPPSLASPRAGAKPPHYAGDIGFTVRAGVTMTGLVGRDAAR